MNKEEVFESIDALKYALDDVDYKLHTLPIKYFRAQRYVKGLRVDKLVILINILQEALGNFYREDFNDLEEITV